jgi:hypothetical protein
LGWLAAEQLLGKTLIVMPPQSRSAVDVKDEWERARAALRSGSIHLPEYDGGGVFTMVRSDEWWCAGSRHAISEEGIRPQLRQLTRSVSRHVS